MTDNREIKFRWFGLEDKKMHYFDLFGCQSSWMIPDQEASEVMQFTGLLDKNGKEIYEGDIVKINRYLGIPTKFEDVIGKIVYRDAKFEVEYDEFFGYCELHRNSEVIGNIYKNPELLK